MRALVFAIYFFVFVNAAAAQTFPPGTFSLGGFPIVCGNNTFIMAPGLNDSGMNDMQGHIYLNPIVLSSLPLVLQLYIVGHECGHSFMGANETAADCWSVKTGRNQGWFPPHAFQGLMVIFQNNPGDVVHPSGIVRVANMMQCYGQP